MFCSERREQSTYCEHCVMATSKVYECYTVKFYKTTPPPKKKFKQGGASPTRRCWIRLWTHTFINSLIWKLFHTCTFTMAQRVITIGLLMTGVAVVGGTLAVWWTGGMPGSPHMTWKLTVNLNQRGIFRYMKMISFMKRHKFLPFLKLKMENSKILDFWDSFIKKKMKT